MTYLESGEPARRRTGCYPGWPDTLAEGVTPERSQMNGVIRGAAAIRTVLAGS
jgi:hypothetical protein